MTWNKDGADSKGILGFWLTYKDGTTTQSLASPTTGITESPVITQTFCGNMIGVGANYRMSSASGSANVEATTAGDSYDDVPVNYYSLIKYFGDFTYALSSAMVTK